MTLFCTLWFVLFLHACRRQFQTASGVFVLKATAFWEKLFFRNSGCWCVFLTWIPFFVFFFFFFFFFFGLSKCILRGQ